MSERIDHAAEALDYVNAVESVAMSPHMATGTLAAAQVHATLALAEQQRIANLIALFTEQDPADLALIGVDKLDVMCQVKNGLGL